MHDVYLACAHRDKKGAFVTIKIKSSNNILANVYGSDTAEAIKNAKELIATVNIGSAFIRERLPAMFVVWRDNVLMTFNTAHEVAIFLWGREVAEWHILKDGIVVSPITSLNISEIERHLENS